MKKRFWKIASAAIATMLVLMVGAVSAAATDEEPIISAPAVTDLSGENAKLIIINQEYTETYDKVFEETLEDEVQKADARWEEFEKEIAEGKISDDPYSIARKNAHKTAQDECERLGLYNTIELTKVDNTSFDFWRGYFEVDSVEGTQLSFYQPDKFSCYFGNRTVTMISKAGYEGNYKKASVSVTYVGKETSSDLARSNKKTLSVTAPWKSGTIKTATYCFSIYAGSGAGTPLTEYAQITLVRKDS